MNATNADQAKAERRSELVERVAAVLLAVAAVATAWSSYQATRWNGEQAKGASRTNAIRIEAARADGLARTETQVDIATFIEWVDATFAGNNELATFYVDRFREGFKPAFDAWMATSPLTTPGAPSSPFAMPIYREAQSAEAERLDRAAAASAEAVLRDIQRSANYVLGVVLFSIALFFAGISTKLRAPRLRIALVTVGCLLFVGTAAWIASFPVSVSV